MEKDTILKAIAILKTNYSNWMKNASIEEGQILINTYLKLFNDVDDNIFNKAILQYISTRNLPPTISDLKDIIASYNIHRLSDNEVWDLIYKAVCNSSYSSHEEWKKLPSDIQQIITPTLLNEMAQQDNESLKYYRKDILKAYNSNFEKQKQLLMVKGNFLKGTSNNRQIETKERD